MAAQKNEFTWGLEPLAAAKHRLDGRLHVYEVDGMEKLFPVFCNNESYYPPTMKLDVWNVQSFVNEFGN